VSLWNGRRVLVCGGSGFVGSHLVELLVAEGAHVRVPTRQPDPPFLQAVKDRIEIAHGDLEDRGFCLDATAGQQVVMHLAAKVGGIGYNRSHHASLFTSNLRPFLNVLDAARFAGVERFLVTSSACVYPRHSRIPTPEEDGMRDEPEPTNGGYGWAKRMQEYAGAAAMKEFGIPVAIARPYNAYGPRDDFSPQTSHVIPALVHKVLSGEDPLVVWGSGEQTRSFLYVKDLARGLMRCVECYVEGSPVNLGGETEISIRKLVEMIVSLTGKRVAIRYDTSQPEGQPRRRCDTTRMKRVLDWEPQTSLETGLQETIAWYRRHGPCASV
jgi:nucleoside-diphosphate-sugar epimerase